MIYPKLNLKTHNNLLKAIFGEKHNTTESLKIVELSMGSKKEFWRDHKMSNSKEDKFIRSAKGPLRKILKKIDSKLLRPFDKNLPLFIYGGVSKKSVSNAVFALLSGKKNQWLLRIDLSRFFEQIDLNRVSKFFYCKCHCSLEVSNMLANLCCVPFGKKNSKSKNQFLARGFNPSSRLATWCNIDFFQQLLGLVKKRLKNKSPKVAIWVDDIGITANNVSRDDLEKLREDILKLAKKFKININLEKTKILSPKENKEFLGTELGRIKNKISRKNRHKKKSILKKIKKIELESSEKNQLKLSLKGIQNFENSIETPKYNYK